MMTAVRFYNLLIIFLFLASCSQKGCTFKGTFLPSGNLQIETSANVKHVLIIDSHNDTVAECPVFGEESINIRFPWQVGESYHVSFDNINAGVISAPAFRPKYHIKIHAPVGQKTFDYYLSGIPEEISDTIMTIAMHDNEITDIIFEVEKLDDTGIVQSTIRVSSISPDTSKLKLIPSNLTDSAFLEFEFDKKSWSLQASLSKSTLKEKAALKAYITIGDWHRSYIMEFSDLPTGTDSLRIVNWALPADENGVSSSRQSSGTILLPNTLWNYISSWFGANIESTNFFKPFTYQTVRLKNNSDEPIGLMLTGEIIDPITDQESHYFKAPDNQFTGGTDKIVSFLTIPPNETETCVLPVYAAQDMPAGAFKSRITVQRLGSDHIITRVENPVTVIRGNKVFTAWTIGIGIISIGWLLATIFLYRYLVKSVGLRILVLLSLLGSLQFCLSFIGRIISSFMYALLGPFNCLVGGLLTEVLTYLLITSILFLVPRVGAMTLAGIVNYIMGGILFGSFGLTDILFLGSGIAFREILLFMFGVTRFKQSANPPAIVPMMLALGIADAASTFTSLTLHSVFYRLYFADWYIFLNVVITGFLYTFIGVYLGKSLGQSLRKVHI
jgi:hypothetical protein